MNIAKFVGTAFFVEKPLVAASDINFHKYVIVPKTVYKLHMRCEDIKVK